MTALSIGAGIPDGAHAQQKRADPLVRKRLVWNDPLESTSSCSSTYRRSEKGSVYLLCCSVYFMLPGATLHFGGKRRDAQESDLLWVYCRDLCFCTRRHKTAPAEGTAAQLAHVPPGQAAAGASLLSVRSTRWPTPSCVYCLVFRVVFKLSALCCPFLWARAAQHRHALCMLCTCWHGM